MNNMTIIRYNSKLEFLTLFIDLIHRMIFVKKYIGLSFVN